jgi:hypothetical protein
MARKLDCVPEEETKRTDVTAKAAKITAATTARSLQDQSPGEQVREHPKVRSPTVDCPIRETIR